MLSPMMHHHDSVKVPLDPLIHKALFMRVVLLFPLEIIEDIFCRSLLVLNLLKLELIVYLKGVRSLLHNNHYEISQFDVAQIHKHTHAHNCKFTYGLPDVISFLCS